MLWAVRWGPGGAALRWERNRSDHDGKLQPRCHVPGRRLCALHHPRLHRGRLLLRLGSLSPRFPRLRDPQREIRVPKPDLFLALVLELAADEG